MSSCQVVRSSWAPPHSATHRRVQYRYVAEETPAPVQRLAVERHAPQPVRLPPKRLLFASIIVSLQAEAAPCAVDRSARELDFAAIRSSAFKVAHCRHLA